MSKLEELIEELRTLPPHQLGDVATYVHNLKVAAMDPEERRAGLTALFGIWSEEEADHFRKVLAEGRRVDESCWTDRFGRERSD
jgi:hypothetical protein